MLLIFYVQQGKNVRNVTVILFSEIVSWSPLYKPLTDESYSKFYPVILGVILLPKQDYYFDAEL